MLGQKMANLVYGRDIKHVMLLHIGGMQTIMLPRLLELLKERGFKLITLQEAELDPAYALDSDTPPQWNGTMLQRMMNAKHLAPLPHSEDPFDKLNSLCRY